MSKKRGTPVGQTIGGIVAGLDQQIFRNLPPVNELVAKGDPLAPVAASGGGTMTVHLPGEVVLGEDPPDEDLPNASAAARRDRRHQS